MSDSPVDSSPFLEDALAYAEAGFAIFPCRRRGKAPLTKHGLKDATQDKGQIRARWLRHPEANIAIATGAPSGIVVVDIDGDEGEATLRKYEEQFGPSPATTAAITGKGRHLYFALPEKIGRVPSSQGGGVDIRADGGYVIAPPSVHPSGKPYAWDERTPEHCAEAPASLIALAKSRKLLSTGVGEASKDKALTSGESPIAGVTLRPLAALVGNLQSPVPWSEAEDARLRSALKVIPAYDREIWFKVGAALHDLAKGDPRWAEPTGRLWDEWSQTCPEKYDPDAQERTWESLGREYQGQRVTVATIYLWAREAGWRDTAPTVGAIENDAGVVPEPSQSTSLNSDGAPPGPSLHEMQATFARLAALSAVDYDRARDDEAKRLRIRVSTLDTEVKKYCPDEEDAAVSGRALSLHAPQPWPEPVDGAALIEAIVAAITQFVALSPASALAAALWCVHAHAFELSYISPRLSITSPEKRCGKTTLLRVLTPLLPKALNAANITVAAMFRTVEVCRPSLLIDEADSFLKENEELRGIINSGHAKDGQVIRLVGDDHEPRAFSTCCPVAIAAIGQLPGTIEDRSILISMRRRRPDERVERFRSDQIEHLHELGRKSARWKADHAAMLRDADPVVPAELNDRAADNWRPLFAIADVTGGVFPQQARAAALSLSAEGPARGESWGTMLLSDIRAIFFEHQVDRFSSEMLVFHLNGLKDRPWSTIRRGKELDPSRLAWMLKPFGIVPGTIRLDKGKTPKGYLRSAFNDAFERYLPFEAATTPQP